jgi:hypothetical protein
MATREGLIDVSQHLATFGPDAANSAMYSRLTTAFENGNALTGTDATFYAHELLESSLMDSGMGARAARLIFLCCRSKYFVCEDLLVSLTLQKWFPRDFGAQFLLVAEARRLAGSRAWDGRGN